MGTAEKEKARKVFRGTEKRSEIYALFSKAGFTDAVIKRSEIGEVILFKQRLLLEQGSQGP